MTTDDRKRRILDHLTRSVEGAGYLPKKSSSSIEPTPSVPEPVAPPPSPASQAKDRKQRIMDHLGMSSEDFGEISSNFKEEQRKQQIKAHLRESGQQ